MRDLRARSITRPTPVFLASSPVSLFVLRLVPDLSFDCSPELECTKIRNVLQCICRAKAVHTFFSLLNHKTLSIWGSASGIVSTTNRPFCSPTKRTLQCLLLLTAIRGYLWFTKKEIYCHRVKIPLHTIKERHCLVPVRRLFRPSRSMHFPWRIRDERPGDGLKNFLGPGDPKSIGLA